MCLSSAKNVGATLAVAQQAPPAIILELIFYLHHAMYL
jgi:hypothetical protein